MNKKPGVTLSNKTEPYFTIVIPTLNEEKFLPDLLNDLTNQTFPKNLFEVVHVDGHSEDKTLQVAASYGENLNLTSVLCDVRNVAVQRNLGGSLAKGRWVVFMDADDRLPLYFLDGLKYQLEKNDADVYSCWMDTNFGTASERAIARATNLGFSLIKQIGIPAAAGAMIISRRDVLKKISFPKENQVAEDTIFMDLAQKNGYKFMILREPRYQFSVRRRRKEGNIKMMVIEAKVAINYLFGDKFISSNHGYVMKGGRYYENIEDDSSDSLIHSLKKYLEKASSQQKEMARRILDQIDAPW